MIANEKQYKISRSRLQRLQKAFNEFDLNTKERAAGSKRLAQAELDAIKSEIEVVQQELNEYESLKSGVIQQFEANSLAELPNVLIKARIARGLKQAELADALGMKPQQIQRYESEKYGTASLSRLMRVAEVLQLNVKEIGDLRATSQPSGEIYPESFPVREMYLRGWFDNFTGSLREAIGHSRELVESLLSNLQSPSVMALNRQFIRSESKVDAMALLAWHSKVIALAGLVEIEAKYRKQTLDSIFIRKLVKLSAEKDGPLLAQEQLRQIGIPLIFLAHLPSTYIDGAAILHKGRPIVALTLRYDRLDNFWFVLLHELAHVKLHLGRGQIESVFDDLESKNAETIECDADDFAMNALIPNSEWETALPRFIQTEDAVTTFATEQGISPSIVAGRIRHESENYTILTALVGQGDVRRLFPQVDTGQ